MESVQQDDRKNNSMNKLRISPFGIILDKEGDVVDHFSINSVVDEVFSYVDRLDRKFPVDAPHMPVVWEGEEWRELKEIVHESKGR
jgi:hypothetical protein